MSARKGRGTKVLTGPKDKGQTASFLDNMDSPNLSAIDRASFLEGLQLNYGNPLHSTAMEEDLNVLEEGQMDKRKAGRKVIPQSLKTTLKHHGTVVKSKETGTDEESSEEEEEKKRSRRSTGEKIKARPERGRERKKKKGEPEGEGTITVPQTNNQPAIKASGPKRLGGRKPAKRRSTDQISAVRPLNNQRMKKDMKRENYSGRGTFTDPQSDEESDNGTAQQSHKRVLSSDEEVDEDSSWNPRSKKAKVYNFGRTRKSSSHGSKSRKSSSDGLKSKKSSSDGSKSKKSSSDGSKSRKSSSDGSKSRKSSSDGSKSRKSSSDGSKSRKPSSDRSKSRKSSSAPECRTSAEPEKADADKQKGARRGRQGGTDLEVVLDAFLDFCEQYSESVESKAVKKSIDSFSSNVKEQLLEKISSYKELRVLKRENAKVGSLIRTKTQRLLDAKHELMRAERQVWLLQKEKAELKLRLADLRRSFAFLHDLGELNQQYLDYQHKHPKERATYGASSLPALILETKYIQAAEHRLRRINGQMEKRLKMTGT